MNIDFSTLLALAIPEGEVVKITNAAGKVLWVAATGNTMILDFGVLDSATLE